MCTNIKESGFEDLLRHFVHLNGYERGQKCGGFCHCGDESRQSKQTNPQHQLYRMFSRDGQQSQAITRMQGRKGDVDTPLQGRHPYDPRLYGHS